MIESNIINWIDLGDSMQSLDVYGKKKWVKFFNFIRVLVNFKTFSIFFYIILKFFFFLQILMLTLVNIEDDNDSAIVILKYISKVIFIQEIITDNQSYKIAIIINSVLTLVVIICIIYLIVSIKIGKFFMKIPIYLFNLINVILMNYLIGPIVQISIMATQCDGGTHKYLGVSCYSDWTHLAILIVSIVNLLFFLCVSIALSIYYNEIGSVNETKVCARINCNYEIYMNIAKILMFVLAYFLQNYGENTKVYKIILEAYIFLNALCFSIYVYKTVLFYDNRMNIVILYGWVFVTWFSFVIGIKTLLDITDTTIFHIVGWIVLGFILYFMEEYRSEYLLTDFNIFEAKTLKEIELFNQTLLSLMNQRSVRAKTLLVGIVKKFEEYTKNSPELTEKFSKLSQNEHLKKKFNSNSALPILSIVYIIYDHHLDKSLLKNDILLNMCYFLMNKFKNATFAVNLCSKFKVVSHKHLYFKYILMEEIKEYLVNKLSKSNNKESIKHVQIGSVILYNIYMDLFKIKIYDAACNQIDYFDILKNNVTTPKTTENFLKIGEDILNLRKEILKLWEKIIELNPFSDESEKDYMLYLETILQDDILARTEAKKFSTLKTNKLSERNNIYHSMFIRDLSSIILIDGYSTNGKILYTTPNFPMLFNFSGKEILNMSVDDLLPNVIQTFHKDLVEDAIKFSNINYIFSTQRDMLLKGKTGGIFNIKLFVKCVPNLSFGLIYMAHITKVQDHNYIIVLDKDFKINGLTEMMVQGGANFTMNNNYGLSFNVLNGHHIADVLPEILLQMESKDQKFYIPKSDIDLKGNLYPVNPYKELENKVEAVLDRIKQCGKLQNEDEQKRDTIQEYEELIKDVSSRYPKPFSVFYKIVTKTFLDGKHKYHRVYITNDLIALNENSHSYPSVLISGSGSKKLKKNESKMTSLPDVKESGKQIKLKVGGDRGSENKGLLEDKKDDEEKKEDENGEEKKDLEQQPANDFSKPSSSPSSVLTKSSIDSASFNKLKNGILEKKEVSSIKIMKYLCLAFGAFTILLIVLNSNSIENNFSDLDEYLRQNLFFNHSKISVSCVYLSTVNLKWVKDQLMDSDNCTLAEGNSCTSFYSSLLSTCINDIKTQKENSSYFYEDFKDILGQSKEIELEVYNLTVKDVLTIDIDNLLNLLISNGLKLNANLDTYKSTTDNVYDINSVNILQQSLDYINDNTVSGFDDSQKKKNINDQFSPVPICLIIDCVIFAILIFGFGWLIFQLYQMETLYLAKLIQFHSVPFEGYLKKLEDLKKKLRNDNGEDDDKINGEMDLNDFGSKKGSKKEDDEEEGTGKEKKKRKDEKEDNKENHKKNPKKSKKNSKLSKQNQQKNEKKKLMSKYFFKYNVFFTFKVMIVLILAVTYYLVISLIESSKKSDYLSFDSTTNSIEGVYRSSFDIFLMLKTQLATYESKMVEKIQANNALETPVEPFDPEEGLEGTMTIPANNEITTPKLGNLLMPLVNNLNGASEATNELNNLYNSDACLVLFTDNSSAEYQSCSTFWSSILVKGMEQSITQMSVVINTVIDELNSLNMGKKKFEDIVSNESSFSQYELFVEYYLFKSYMKTVDLFSVLKEAKVNSIYNIFRVILYCYVVGVVILFFVLLYFVYSSKFVFNTFLNFIGILPVKYLIEDDGLYKDILKLEQHIF